MPAHRGRTALLSAALLAAGVVVWASDRSEILVAKGQVAYHAGRYDEARALFEQAVAEDARDVDARYQLGVTFSTLGRWEEAAAAFQQALTLRPDFAAAQRALAAARAETEPEAAGIEAPAVAPRRKPWEVHAAVGVEYDSNVELNQAGLRRGDSGFLLSGGGRYDLLNTEKLFARAEYDVYQDWHPNIRDFDFLSNRLRGTLSYAIRPYLWVGAQGGYNRYRLGSESYLGEPFAMPFLSLLEESWGMTQLIYRHGDSTYFSTDLENVADGTSNSIGMDQTLYFGQGTRYVTVGYAYEQYNPDDPGRPGGVQDPETCNERRPYPASRCLVGNDFQEVANQVYIGGGFPAWWGIAVDLLYLYRNDDYSKKNSATAFQERRTDNEHHFYAGLRRGITEHVGVVLAYYGTVNPSSIGIYDYRRNVISGLVEVTY